MRPTWVTSLPIAALICLLLSGQCISHATSDTPACVEKRIHISTMGSTDDAKQFIFLVEQALSKRGFTIERTPETADAILSGAVTTNDERGNSFENPPVAYVTATLVTKGGQEIWRGYFKPHPGFHPPTKSSLEIRAGELAKDLERKCSRGWRDK